MQENQLECTGIQNTTIFCRIGPSYRARCKDNKISPLILTSLSSSSKVRWQHYISNKRWHRSACCIHCSSLSVQILFSSRASCVKRPSFSKQQSEVLVMVINALYSNYKVALDAKCIACMAGGAGPGLARCREGCTMPQSHLDPGDGLYLGPEGASPATVVVCMAPVTLTELCLQPATKALSSSSGNFLALYLAYSEQCSVWLISGRISYSQSRLTIFF